MTEEIEFIFADEARTFLLKRKCPSCGGSVYLHRHTESDKVAWTVECGSTHPCHATNPVDDQRDAYRQWKIICALVRR